MFVVTGATGFVGSAVVCELVRRGKAVTAVVRSHSGDLPASVKQVVAPDLSRDADYGDIFDGVDVVIHIAGRAHVLQDNSENPLETFRRINTDIPIQLARKAAESGVRRFIFLSSIGVNGDLSQVPFVETDMACPHNAYTVSKYEAEQGLLKLSRETQMEVVVIRPPLVYAMHAPGNFGVLVKWVDKGLPLPLGAVHNKRSLIALDNLVDFIILCTQHPKAANEVFLISDGDDVSTTELLQKVAKAKGKKACLIPVPVGLMTFVAKLVGKEDVAKRLFGSLQVDSAKARRLLGWKPVISMDEQLRKTVAAYKKA